MPEVIFPGPEGRLEGRFAPAPRPRAPVAMILHPHPQSGGTMNNRIVQELYKTFQRRGFATRLLRRVLEIADALGLATVKLDATEQGKPLYQSLGFRAEQAIERWCREGRPLVEASCFEPADYEEAIALDRGVFGADRAELLARLRTESVPLTSKHGYLFHRAGSKASYLGPCVAKHSDSAENLLWAYFQAAAENQFYWDLLPANHHAARLATRLGFAPQRRLIRMVRGAELRANDLCVYAIAGFELG